MELHEQIQYWVSSAESDLTVAEHLFEKRDYAWCLFIGHLVLEKTLKAIYIEAIGENPPRSHDLVKLSQTARLNPDPDLIVFLDRVTQFNIEARYPDVKKDFQKICTKEFAEANFTKIKEVHSWLKSRLK
ncbi:MAG: HEPN domain-containing protein [Candidatus Wallbacteria bacterium]|nr:HEPN domain-containing protein [Candidatus Wallbacteria bacterium]